ncbi:DnaA regulatory inactivator Hda [Legionella dresdenensis]|uniref:DnaA regulatory inactivator Hda n=1 Tax=Legionella dresdenensis TaxID=450200 RepID=A0ABV8CF25_9GAMM
MNSSQLALAIKLDEQATLDDYCWGNNTILQQQLDHTLYHNGERLLYLWGETGCGKSHILQACCHAINRQSTAAYLPLNFLRDWDTESIEGMDEQDLIALDDIDAIAGNAAWEEAIFHLYNRIRDNGRTILLISGKTPPASSPIQLPDLRSRLAWSLVIQIEPPDDALKITALQKQAQKRGFELPDSVALFMINRCARNMHELYHILDRLDEASLAAQRKITIPFVKMVLGI